MSKDQEQIWAIDRPPTLEFGLWPQGNLDAVCTELRRHNPRLVQRGPAETNEELKQIIPYVTLLSPNHKRVFAYQRTKDGGEGRLHGKWSIGVGGHLNDDDGLDDDLSFLDRVIIAGYDREMKEELGDSVTGNKSFGFINEDETPVGRVHLGVSIAITVGTTGAGKETQLTRALEIAPREEMINSGWLLWSDVLRRREEFEIWSQIVADYYAVEGEDGRSAGADPST